MIGNEKAVRAVAHAIGANGIDILIPCHRVVGSNHALTGFAGGLDRKEHLLKLEGHLWAVSEIHFEAKAEDFVELKVTFSLLTCHGIIKAGIDEEASGEEIIDFQVKRILPLHLHLAVVREVVETGDPGNLLTDVPLAVDGDVRTSFPFRNSFTLS